MEIPELLEACEKTYAVMVNARSVAQSEGDAQRVMHYDAEMIKTEETINKLRSVLGQEPVSHSEPNFDTIVDRVVARLTPTAETVPQELKDTLVWTNQFLDTVLDGDGIKFFGTGLTTEKQTEIKLVQDELRKWTL